MSNIEVVLGKGSARIEVDGNTYRLSRIELNELAEFRTWLQENKLETFMRSAKSAGLSQELFTSTVEKILNSGNEITKLPEGSTEGPDTFRDTDGTLYRVFDPVQKALASESGMVHLIWLSVRKNHPDVEKDELAFDFDDLQKISSVIAAISGLGEDDEEDSEEDEGKGDGGPTPTNNNHPPEE